MLVGVIAYMSVESSAVGQTLLPQDNIIGLITQIAWWGFFIVYMFYGQKLQVRIMLSEIAGSLFKLKLIRDRGRSIAITTIKGMAGSDNDITSRIDRILDHIFIPLESLDPYGIIRKLEHFLDVRDVRFKEEVRIMVPDGNETQINNLSNVLEAALSLNQLYKFVRHFYLTGKKNSSFYIIMQLQMILPQIMKASKAYANALIAFKVGQPIGDGIGPLVAARIIQRNPKTEMAKDMVVSKVSFEGRIAYVLKAKGPGGNVGKPGEAVRQLIEEKEGNIKRVVVIDAAQKLEGEKLGEVVEGTGVAIGGPGVDKFKVEEAATKYKIPIHAVLVKVGISDVVATMSKELTESVDEVINRIRRIVKENTNEGDHLIIAGIGNTMGIAQ